MNQERQIQLLYPPFFFFAAVCAAVYLDPKKTICDYLPSTAVSPLVAMIAAGGVLIIVVGFGIGTIPNVALRFLFLLGGKKQYEAVLRRDCIDRIWKKLKTTQQFDEQLALFATATFDHELLPKGIHEWLLRRWSAFNICTRSFVALALACICVPLGSLHPGCYWYTPIIGMMVLLAIQGALAWRETMAMFEFQSYRDLPVCRDEKPGK